MPTFEGVFLPDSLVLQRSITDDKQAVTIMVENIQVQLAARDKPIPPAHLTVGRGLGDSPLVAYRLGNLFVELHGDEAPVTVRVDIRGGVDTKLGARAVLVSRIAGLTCTDELATGEKSEEYALRYSVNVLPRNGLSVTLLLLVDRDIVDGALPFASASVDSIDLVVESPASS